MKNYLVIAIYAAIASISATVILKLLGAESSVVIGGGVGGGVGAAFLSMKLYGKKQR
jgi:hypothetical protein